MSNANLEQLLAAQKANNEILVGLLRKTLDGVERLAALNISASREFLDTAVAGVQQIATLKDPKELAKVGSDIAAPGMEKVVGYSKSVYDVVSSLQQEVISVAETQMSKAREATAAALDKVTASAPAGSEAFTAAVKSAFAASNQAVDNLTAATKQMAAAAESNLKAAAETATKVVASAPGKKK